MKLAHEYYKASYLNNLSKYLKSLVKSERLRNAGQNLYALPPAERQRMLAAVGTNH
jgi:hypothetical protein